MTAQQGGQAAEIKRSLTCYALKKNVTSRRDGKWARRNASLHTRNGRKYLTLAERDRAIAAIGGLPRLYALYVEVLAYSGARPSEILNLTARSFDLDSRSVTIITLKQRQFSVREVPLPDGLLDSLEDFFSLRRLQCDEEAGLVRLWPFSRMTAWRKIKVVMHAAGIVGPQGCPKGFRHGFGHAHRREGTPPHQIQFWLGHSNLATTSIYMGISASEERAYASRLWKKKRRNNSVGLHALLSQLRSWFLEGIVHGFERKAA